MAMRIKPGRPLPLPDIDAPKPRFKLWRAPNEAPEMDAAKTALENASAALCDAADVDEQATAIAQHDQAKRRLGLLLLERDKAQRPHIYRRDKG